MWGRGIRLAGWGWGWGVARNQVSRVLCPKSNRRPLVAIRCVTQYLARKSEMEGREREEWRRKEGNKI